MQFATFHDLEDQSIFITGGGSGIGADLTKGFLSQGSKVTFIQRSNPERFLIDCKGKYKHEPSFLECDVTNTKELKTALQRTAKKQGPISVLVNNAANDTRHSLGDFTSEQWDKTMNVNLKPHFFAAQEVIEGMKKNGGGSIINFSSISYMMGNEGYPAYATAKSAITGLTRSLARELGPFNIRVNAVMPGWVLTKRQMNLWATEDGLSKHLDRQCLKEHLSGADIVGGTLFLASGTSKMMTSQALVIDGGVVVTG
jgi:NAD(P)-dependent dehydrogenase (short-subunit alcohol dehydrogenase family)